MSATEWMGSNLTTQGYGLSESEQRRLWLGLRFPTGACLVLVITTLALESAPTLFVLVGIGAIGGFTSRHPFDYVWNHAVRHLFKAPVLPPNPPRRRHAFKVATVWLLVVAVLLTVGLTAAALVLGLLMVGACTAVTVANLCLPSELFAWWDRHRDKEISTEPIQDFVVATGRPRGEDLGYTDELARVPERSVKSFAGVANRLFAHREAEIPCTSKRGRGR